ncbi:aspartate aminotransferase family protein [Truepera radiovictrix]|uniref:alanine--glyoxylate transaminase n=1 Tax=Truepera radiovictrix (strain DSM 17093 / CIP 108686 / LMG 22925 / RQ-24) TaxID=649638 RepID=D7CQU0_TRURR|nr:aspartate aminotransferase family protein [Truepera radiovictrix]ADI15074.1 aminotransferase class-III [Truepera radiovictrix DSM 17093]WMT56373.1 aspartate aminotransferase family protein [Truepera radiovictrix]
MTTTASKTQDLRERQQRFLIPSLSNMLYYGDEPLAVERAKDQYVWDIEGRRYLDFFGGILTISVGHCNDEVVEATYAQMKRLGHTSTLYLNEVTLNVAEKIAEITPGRLQKCFFTNSGTEADEMAILAARVYTGNTDIIALRHAYSGRSSAMMSMTAHANWRLGGVYDGTIKHVRSPNMYRRPEGMSEEAYLDFLVADFEDFLATCTDGRIAAFIAEPIQGVGGFVVLPKDYFKRILPLVKAAGGVLIVDEVQTGWGRTGRYWCGIEHWGVEPDIMTFAKGIANGAPVGCTIMTPEVAEAMSGLTLSTYGGNPVSMAQAYATISYIEKHRLWENAEVQGGALRAFMEEQAERYDFIGDVRGMGLMQAFEMVQPGTKTPDPERANALVAAARKRGLLIGKGGRYGNVSRVAPHLNVSSEDVATGCELLGAALADIA